LGLDISNFFFPTIDKLKYVLGMGWIQAEIEEIDDLIRGRSLIGANASIQGLCFTPRLSNYEEILLPAQLRNKADKRPDTTKRTQANKERKGRTIARTGRYTRTNEVRRRVHAWIDHKGGAQRVKFWTVTFPQGTPDPIVFKAFNILLTRWRKAIPDLSYLWTAERQQNHTAHFHMVTDSYMDVRLLNAWMRKTLSNMGAMVPWSDPSHIAAYNGVTISPSVYTRCGVEAYLVKYLTKAIGSGFKQGWHCSRNIGTIRTRAKVDRNTAFECIGDEVRRSGKRDSKVRALVEDSFIYVPFKSQVNRRIADRLLDENIRVWRKNTQSCRSLSHVRPVEHPIKHPLLTAMTTVGDQLTLLSVPVSEWTPPPRNQTKSRHKVYSWAPVYAASD
jgi:hypothetical protein